MTLFQDPPNQDQKEIASVVKLYIDGYLGQEAAMLRRAFEAEAKLMTIDEGDFESTPTKTWFSSIETKRRGGSGTLTGRSKILGIDCTRDAAVAKVHLDFDTHEFTDYLALLKSNQGWQIVNKIYEARSK